MERTLQNFMVMLVFWDFVPGTSDPTSCLSWMREGAGAWWCKYSLEVECTEFCFCLWALSDKCFLVIILASAASPPALKVYCRPRQLWLGSGGDGAYLTKSYGNAWLMNSCAWYEWPYLLSQLEEGGGCCLIVWIFAMTWVHRALCLCLFIVPRSIV